MSKPFLKDCRLQATDLQVLTDELLKSGHSVRFRAHGISMTPFICDADIVTVAPVHIQDLTHGDVVLFQWDQPPLILHRIVKIHEVDGQRHLVTRGDSSLYAQERFTSDRLLGKVQSVKHGTRTFSLETQHARWMARLWLWAHPLRYVTIVISRYARKRLTKHQPPEHSA